MPHRVLNRASSVFSVSPDVLWSSTGLVTLLCLASGCAPATVAEPGTLPLLGDDGVHLYVQEAYEVFPEPVTDAVAARYAELVEAGMDHARHLFDWSVLEPSPGVFDTAVVTEALDARLASGISRQFCNISVIDSFGPEAIPADVLQLLEDGASWDDPQIVDRFKGVIDAVVPLMLDRGVYMLGLANEPGGYLGEDPALAVGFAGFVEQVVSHVHAIAPELACTVVFAGPSDAAIPTLMPLLDVASFNGYAYDFVESSTCQVEGVNLPLYEASTGDGVGPLLDQMIEAADGRLICVQEFGQATGWGDMPLTLGANAGLDNQKAIMDAVVEALDERRAHFRTFCLWTLNDHSMEGIAYVGDALEAEGFPSCFADNAEEIFGPTGIVRSDETASKKPAFDAFKQGVTFFAAGAEPVPGMSLWGGIVLMLGMSACGTFLLCYWSPRS